MASRNNNSSPDNTFSFYTNAEYWAQLTTLLKKTKPGDRVLLMSMTFEPTEPAIAEVVEELDAAAARGVHVVLSLDAHTFLLHPTRHTPGPMWARRTMPKVMLPYYRNKLRIIEQLDSYPTGHSTLLNLPSHATYLAISGRSHIKTAIVNDHIFLGGCNLQGSQSVDMMIGWRDKTVSDRLYRIFQNITRHRHAGRALSWVDRGMSVDAFTDIFIDSGLRNQSLIMDEALALIDAAQKWLVITCQFFPNSTTAKHLAAAVKRGVDVQVIYAHPLHHGPIGGAGQHISILRERTRVPKTLFAHALTRKDPKLHAKLIACDKGVMIGSHNYVTAGVILGTAEIALKSSSEQLALQAVETLRRGLKQSKQG